MAQRRRTEAQGAERGQTLRRKLASDQQSVSSSSSSDRSRSLEYSTSSCTPPFVQTTFDLNLVSSSQVSRIVLGRDMLVREYEKQSSDKRPRFTLNRMSQQISKKRKVSIGSDEEMSRTWV